MLLQPPVQIGLKQIQRELFSSQHTVGALIIKVEHLKEIMALRKEGLLNIPRCQSIVGIPSSTTSKKVLLSPEIGYDSSLDWPGIESLPLKIQQFAERTKAELTTHTITLDYDYWNTEQILRAIIPQELDVPVSFATVGHIAHFNLREELQPYKKLIGEVVLDVCAINPEIKKHFDRREQTGFDWPYVSFLSNGIASW